MELSPEGLKLLLEGEVGGGRPYYERVCMHPVVPGGRDTRSGVTIGIGWDLGQCSSGAFTAGWGAYLSWEIMAKLTTVVGLRGLEAKKSLPGISNISIPWETALEQFLAHSVPRYWTLTEAAFAGIDAAPRCVREGLLSLVFNRGTSMAGDRRREMRTIRDLVAEQRWPEIPDQVCKMKRLWPDTEGLRTRREAEARHIESGLSRSADAEAIESGPPPATPA